MARKPRLHIPSGLYHIVLRGWDGIPIFREPEDWRTFERLTAHAVSVCNSRVHAYCWLPAQAHFALEVGNVRSGAVMQRICGPYARYVRRKFGIDRVFRSRYRACPIDRELHLLNLVRHISRLPLAAGHIDLDKYAWSSHIAYLGRRQCPWLRTEELWEALAWHDTDVQRAYHKLISTPPTAAESAMFTHALECGRHTAGKLTYLEWVATHPQRRPISLAQILDLVAKRVDVPVEVIRSRSRRRQPSLARALAAWHAFRAGVASFAEISRQLERDPSFVSGSIEFHKRLQPELFNESLEELISWDQPMPIVATLNTVSATDSLSHPRSSAGRGRRQRH